ncbi:ACP S-malonyltransferase [Bacteroidetes bacterium endosymbiont of Geopemphigus sp.]|uniref:ACP S-malonyltransferase n=1 Tax=Bacteroidetes bacterium endosymbiont of Geopemphigus sp. TaxID=2047937 RepID=UPI000CD24A0E|nr:ACP S-malonyltransferase [Bacteroidetes bacterium endosymbiont of Geopemphigus sp.]
MKAYIFPGQGTQYSGMGRELYENPKGKALFERANEILGFRITDIMFKGNTEDLRQTHITQLSVYLHSVILVKTLDNFAPGMVAGHSLGEFSALVAAGGLDFEAGLELVYQRAMAMQEACELEPSGMAAVLGLEDQIVEEICKNTQGTVVPANYNCRGQLVVSGEKRALEKACEAMKNKDAKRVLMLAVGGAFHSPLMEPARKKLADTIKKTSIKRPCCPIYQNVHGQGCEDPDIIKKHLIEQLTAPVRWRQSIEKMIGEGANIFIETGPGKVLQGLVKKIHPQFKTCSAEPTL